MTTITEDYVSFEVAKLLKEKGFDSDEVGCYGGFYSERYYESGHGIKTQSGQEVGIVYDDLTNSDLEHDEYLRPTLQMAMKWLRIEHNIHIEPHIVRTKCSYGYMPNYININDLTQHFPFKEIDFCDLEKYVCMTYDKACETAIKYCLENLI